MEADLADINAGGAAELAYCRVLGGEFPSGFSYFDQLGKVVSFVQRVQANEWCRRYSIEIIAMIVDTHVSYLMLMHETVFLLYSRFARLTQDCSAGSRQGKNCLYKSVDFVMFSQHPLTSPLVYMSHHTNIGPAWSWYLVHVPDLEAECLPCCR